MKHTSIAYRCLALALITAVFASACNGATSPTAPTTTVAQSATTTTMTTGTPTSATGGTAAACATGDGVTDACACDGDSQLYCSGFYSADWQAYARAHGYTTASWKYGLLDCLDKNPISIACSVSLDRREVLNAQMMSSCARYCRGTQPRPGAEPCVDHLKSIYDTLDNACRTALDAHEAAKPLTGNGPF